MADASAKIAGEAVKFLLENFKQMLIKYANLITRSQDQVELLEEDLRCLTDFLVHLTSKKGSKDDTIRRLLRSIRDCIYDADDIIDAFMTHAVQRKSKICSLRNIQNRSKLLNIAKRAESLCSRIRDICNEIKERTSLCTGDEELEEHEAPVLREDNVVGLAEEEKQLTEYLNEETQELDVISIVAAPGGGKTTLGFKMFRNQAIRNKFPVRIWVHVSDANKKNVFLAILSGLNALTEDVHRKRDEELAQLIAAHLGKSKFLIVMDDVCAAEDWKELRIAFPKNNKMGKVLITSCHEEVARIANPNRPPVKLKPLSLDESWRLLQLQVFGKPKCPPELELLGNLIAEQCGGLPLPLVLIGDVLAKKDSESDKMSVRRRTWERVCASMSTYFNDDPTRAREKSMSSSYDKLPFHLRSCFLYFGMFPEDFEIPVWKLVCMWMAEGFVQQRDGLSLDLISRNLITVEKKGHDGSVKTCRMGYLLHDFCKAEAGNERENFLQEMKMSSSDGAFHPPISDVHKYRRLCIHSNVMDFVSSKPRTASRRVRSFVCFSREEITLKAKDVSDFPAAYKLLRVWDAKPIKFTKIPSGLYELVHLRYVALSLNVAVLPAAFSKLCSIETLILYTSSRTLKIKADLLSMVQLRHFKTNVSATLPKTSKSSKEGKKLQTVSAISPKSCTGEVFDRARNVKKLGIRGPLSLLLDDKIGSFDSLGRLSKLEKLKLLNDVFPRPSWEGQLRGLPPPYKFPPKLRSLTLSDTFLAWSQMSILGLLENLEVLNLKDNAFVGWSWEVADGGFCRLQVLHIGRTDVVPWLASSHHFPQLRRLELWNCEKLREVPSWLADIPTLELLQLCNGTTSAAASAKKIRDERQRIMRQQGQTANKTVLRISIFPHDE